VPPILSLVMDRSICRLPPAKATELAVAGGVDWVQLRERELTDRALLQFSREIAAAAERGAKAAGRRVRLLVNRRVDLALVLEVDGVHLGTGAMEAVDVRALRPDSSYLVGVSTHQPSEVRKAVRTGADYVHLAPIYAPRSKALTRPPLGLEAVRHACRAGIDVFAQGGVGATHCRELIGAGAAGVAVTGEILMSERPDKAAAALRRALDGESR
jgi:thiamine-phosphate pyrophosphorylase